MEENVELIQELVVLYGVKIIAALAIFIIGKWVAKRLAGLVQKVLQKKQH
jgi:small conductance mechanosensitive channel